MLPASTLPSVLKVGHGSKVESKVLPAASSNLGLGTKRMGEIFTGFMGDNPRVGSRNVTLNAGIDFSRNVFIL